MSLRERTRAFVRALILLSLLLAPGLARADEPTITITVGDNKRSFTRGELLARADATTIEVARDITFRLPMSYRAVRVAALLAGMTLPPDSVIEAVALDGFVAQLPPDLMLNTDNRQGHRLACNRTPGSSLAADSGKRHERGTVLHCLDRGRRWQHPK